MTEQGPAHAGRAAELRRAFDQGFAKAPASLETAFEELLAIRVCGAPYALPLAALASVMRARKIVPLPSPLPELLGLVGVRGSSVPVYDLGALLGHTRSEAPSWLVIASHAQPLALAFDELEGQLRATASQIAGDRVDGGHRVVRTGDTVRPIIDLASLLEAIARRVHPPKEP